MDTPVAVITGTRTGIGRGLAEHFLTAGYSVAGCSRGSSTLDNPGYEHAELDVGDEQAVRAWVRHISRQHGRIDVLVVNAGLVSAATVMTLTSGDLLNAVMRTNVAGAYYVCREVAKVMMVRRSGRIVTISSMAVPLHEVGTSAYSASKSALEEMTKVMARELSPFGVTCNIVSPSIVDTHGASTLGEAVTARVLEKLTVKRRVTVEEVFHVVAFFAAPQSACITGQKIHMGLVV